MAKPGWNDIIGLDDIKYNAELHRQLAAEFLGPFLFVIVACGSCVSWQATMGGQTSLTIAFCYGFTGATLAQTLGHVSGAHFNPAVTFGLVAAGDNTILKAVLYTTAHCVGATLGAICLYGAIPKQMRLTGLGDTNFEEPVSAYQALFIEFVITFVLVLTVCGVNDRLRRDVKGSAPLAIGLCVIGCALFAIPFTGASMNPAVSFGRAILSGNRDVIGHHWVYWVGPMSGGVTAGLVYRLFRAKVSLEPDSSLVTLP